MGRIKMLIQLPNGLLDGADFFNFAEIDELRGRQQNYLANRELVVGNIGHIPKILEDCVLSLQTKEGLKWEGQIKDAVQKLSSGDIETLLIKIRENTYGERFYYESECPHCQAKNKNLRVDLDKLEIDIMPLDQIMDKSRLTFTLPKEGKEVEVKPIYLKDMFESVKVLKGKQDELITSVLSLSIKRLGDNTKVTAKDIEKLSMKDIMFLSEKLENVKVEGSIDTNIESTCSNCNKDFSTRLDVYSADFFVHSKGSTTTRI
jgi:hypothetical protein